MELCESVLEIMVLTQPQAFLTQGTEFNYFDKKWTENFFD